MGSTGTGGSGTGKKKAARGRRGADVDAVRGRVRAHDPFELIRWLALSQPDPRKALAELVQNSLDAGARRIRVTRLRERGVLCLKILDDGEGVIPEMDRPEALRYIATHIGHSRKRSLSPQERMALMTQGQYGIGLLGFWSLGETLEMRSAVPGQRAHRLVLHRDRPDFLIEPLRGRLPLDERWTEVVVLGLHREALGALSGRRAADYLAAELRGQLLAREVDVQVEDRVSRGRAQKIVPVRPPRFLGERIEGIGQLPVAGLPPIRLEIYLTGENGEGAQPAGISIYAAGTLVAESFHDLSSLGMDRAPWNDPRLSGMIDFPGFHVAPGSRRGILVDEAAGAFARALGGIESILLELLENLERRKSEELDRGLIRDLQRAFRDFYRRSPRYAMLPVQSEKDEASGPAGAAEGATDGGDGEAGAGDRGPDEAEPDSDAGVAEATAESAQESPPEPIQGATPERSIDLFPPGPLSSVVIVPANIRVECGGRRTVRAEGFDAAGRPIPERFECAWELSERLGRLEACEASESMSEARVVLVAGADPAEGVLSVLARSRGREAYAEAPVEVVEQLGSGRSREGIPEPEFLDHPGASWRSRMLEDRWQVNSGHKDYRAIADRPALKLRYLAMLFAKEIVLRSHQDPRLEKPLEQIVEVFSYADRNLASKRGTRRKGGGARTARDAATGLPGDAEG